MGVHGTLASHLLKDPAELYYNHDRVIALATSPSSTIVGPLQSSSSRTTSCTEESMSMRSSSSIPVSSSFLSSRSSFLSFPAALQAAESGADFLEDFSAKYKRIRELQSTQENFDAWQSSRDPHTKNLLKRLQNKLDEYLKIVGGGGGEKGADGEEVTKK
ncbi:unnamed protein product [Amoebophrya sp. A25]|nr:unnamed protein product [Amoebophrya sp. A25]|eukprot:GSA25T00019396001.1